MSCSAIVNVTAQLTIDLKPLIRNPDLARAAAQGLANLLGLNNESVDTTRGNGYVLLWIAGAIGVTVYVSGEISCTDFRPYSTLEDAETIRQAAVQIITALAGLALQSQLAILIGQLAPISATQRAENGALVLTVDL